MREDDYKFGLAWRVVAGASTIALLAWSLVVVSLAWRAEPGGEPRLHPENVIIGICGLVWAYCFGGMAMTGSFARWRR